MPLAGGVLVALNVRLSHNEIGYISRHSGAKLLIVAEELLPNVPGVDDLGDVAEVIVISDSESDATPVGGGGDRGILELPSSARPRLRGVWHKWACLGSVPLGAALVIVAQDARARVAVGVYAVTLVALFGVSALYHLVNWSSISARRWMRRLDHSMIFMLIAGTYTPFAVLTLHGALALAILVAVWTGALTGAIFNLIWSTAPKWLRAVIYISLGWVAVAAMPQLSAAIGIAGLALLALGGLLYTAGAVIYAMKRPDPLPAVFGYHEVFHALVILAAAIQYAVIAFWVLPG